MDLSLSFGLIRQSSKGAYYAEGRDSLEDPNSGYQAIAVVGSRVIFTSASRHAVWISFVVVDFVQGVDGVREVPWHLLVSVFAILVRLFSSGLLAFINALGSGVVATVVITIIGLPGYRFTARTRSMIINGATGAMGCLLIFARVVIWGGVRIGVVRSVIMRHLRSEVDKSNGTFGLVTLEVGEFAPRVADEKE
ncbi:hypothetical protein F4778DRAFT_755305 [Xylariomycetidae sp. FL2044]|nr:hypothetical protein F4778DRAFT_755305 [Xylariomycetidae sp. FL2044]